MYARSTTVRGDPQKIDDGIAYVRDEVMPAVQQMNGCVGLSMLGDRESGRCIVTTAWADETAMHATEEAVHPMRERFAEMFGGQAEVNEWEIAVLHRMHEAPEGACTRVIWTRGDPGQMDRTIDAFRMALISRLEELRRVLQRQRDGQPRQRHERTRGDLHEPGRRCSGTREAVSKMRDEFTQQLGMEVTDIAEFDLVLAHLRVPETV